MGDALPKRLILGVFPFIGGGGGVERASRHAAAVLQDFATCRGTTFRFLGLNDPPGRQAVEAADTTIPFEGFARAKYRLAFAAASERPSLVFVGHPNLAPVGAAVKMMTDAPVAVMCWGIDVWTPLALHRRAALRYADAVCPISTHTAREVVRHQGVSDARVRLLPLALEPLFWRRAQAAADIARPPQLPPGRIILSVTRLAAEEGYKGVDTVIEALPAVRTVVPDVQYVVIGSGTDQPRLEARARAVGVADRVHFLGRMEANSPDLIGAYQHADVFALPSKGEGFGIVFLEAMAFGTPVIGGAHAGTLDVIEDGVSGRLVTHGAVADLAQALQKLLTDEPYRRTIGEAGRHRVAAKYLLPNFKDRLTAILIELLHRV